MNQKYSEKKTHREIWTYAMFSLTTSVIRYEYVSVASGRLMLRIDQYETMLVASIQNSPHVIVASSWAQLDTDTSGTPNTDEHLEHL
jgi:hypothetical protein